MSMGRESTEIFQRALQIGEFRLSKPITETAVSAFIGGIYVTFGALAALTTSAIFTEVSGSHHLGWFMGSTMYPIGFIFVVIGKSELFTENFVTPVLAVWEGESSLGELSTLWSIALLFNLLGILTITFFLGTSNFISGKTPGRANVVRELQWVSDHVFAESSYAFFWKSIIGGLLINFMSWLVIASRGTLSKVVMIWIPTFLIMLLGAHHCIVGSAEVLLGIYYGSGYGLGHWFVGYLLPAAFGNALGGIVFVAFLHIIQESPDYLHWS